MLRSRFRPRKEYGPLLVRYVQRSHTHGAAVIGKIDGLEREELKMSQLLAKVKPYVWPTKDSPDAGIRSFLSFEDF